jgi:hypothetical protein
MKGGKSLRIPSRGCTKGCAFCAPLMSNVRRHTKCSASVLKLLLLVRYLARRPPSRIWPVSSLAPPPTASWVLASAWLARSRLASCALPLSLSHSHSLLFSWSGLPMRSLVLVSSPPCRLPRLPLFSYAPPTSQEPLASRSSNQSFPRTHIPSGLFRRSFAFFWPGASLRHTCSVANALTPNPSIEGMPKRLRLLCTPHVKR